MDFSFIMEILQTEEAVHVTTSARLLDSCELFLIGIYVFTIYMWQKWMENTLNNDKREKINWPHSISRCKNYNVRRTIFHNKD